MKTLIIKYLIAIVSVIAFIASVNNAQSQTLGEWQVSYSEMDSIKLEYVPFAYEGSWSARITYYSQNPLAICRLKKAFPNTTRSDTFKCYFNKLVDGGSTGVFKIRLIKDDSIATSYGGAFLDNWNEWVINQQLEPFSPVLSKIDTIEMELSFLGGQSGYCQFYIDGLQIGYWNYSFQMLDRFGDVGKIRGIAWNDTSGNSLYEPGEPPLEGWKVYLSGLTNDSTTVNANGYYEFPNLLHGSYEVLLEQKTGWLQTFP
ncbi:MAG: SdrD B-like domain-containing protein, partial [Patescibacteria group bacterium]